MFTGLHWNIKHYQYIDIQMSEHSEHWTHTQKHPSTLKLMSNQITQCLAIECLKSVQQSASITISIACYQWNERSDICIWALSFLLLWQLIRETEQTRDMEERRRKMREKINYNDKNTICFALLCLNGKKSCDRWIQVESPRTEKLLIPSTFIQINVRLA